LEPLRGALISKSVFGEDPTENRTLPSPNASQSKVALPVNCGRSLTPGPGGVDGTSLLILEVTVVQKSFQSLLGK
jgi:hypothetical protein